MNNIDKHANHESALNTPEVLSISEDIRTSKVETPLSEAERFGSDLEKATRIRRETAKILDKIAEILIKAESAGENTSGKLGFEQDITYLNNVSKNLRQGVFRLLVLGDMKRGKSTLLNAIIGEKILPTGVNPCTAVLTIVRYGENKQVTIHFNDDKPPASMDFNTFKKTYTIPPDEAKKLEIQLNRAIAVLVHVRYTRKGNTLP
jgi:ATPase subunit of ABC transporter with duplicated ATPase domains